MVGRMRDPSMARLGNTNIVQLVPQSSVHFIGQKEKVTVWKIRKKKNKTDHAPVTAMETKVVLSIIGAHLLQMAWLQGNNTP